MQRPQLNKYRKYVQSFKEYTWIGRQLVILVRISSLIVSMSSTPQWAGRWESRAARCRRSAAWRACRWRRRACWGSCQQSRWSVRRSYPAARAQRRSPPGRRLRVARRWTRTGCSYRSAADEEDLQAVINETLPVVTNFFPVHNLFLFHMDQRIKLLC